MVFSNCGRSEKVIGQELFARGHNYGGICGCGCFQHFIGNALVCHVQWFTTCTIGYRVIMYTKMNASPGHPSRGGMNVYNANRVQSNAHRCWTTHLTLDSRPSRGNITHKKWKRGWTSPFSVVVQTTTFPAVGKRFMLFNEIGNGGVSRIMMIGGTTPMAKGSKTKGGAW